MAADQVLRNMPVGWHPLVVNMAAALVLFPYRYGHSSSTRFSAADVWKPMTDLVAGLVAWAGTRRRDLVWSQ